MEAQVLPIELEHASGDEALLRLDTATRRRLASVLADWLSMYAGVQPALLDEENFGLVVEVRRILLLPDETTFNANGA
jgi:hypothetical protein